jgi:hypothetical protein
MDPQETLQRNHTQLELLQKETNEVSHALQGLDKRLHTLERDIPNVLENRHAQYLVDEMKQLRTEKSSLQAKEHQLRQEAGLIREENVFLHRSSLYSTKLAQATSEDQSITATLHSLLTAVLGGAVDEYVLQQMRLRFPQHCATLALLEQSPSLAHELYQQTLQLPDTATEIYLAQEGIALGVQAFHGTRSLLPAFRADATPCVLKMLQEEELKRLRGFQTASNGQYKVHHIVSYELYSVECKHMMLMQPRAVCALNELPVPLQQKWISKLYHDLSDALAFIHAAGYAHLVVTPSSVLLTESGAFLLAELGSLALLGSYTSSNMTATYLPADYPGRHAFSAYLQRLVSSASVQATAQADWWMLARLLAVLLGAVDAMMEVSMAQLQGALQESLCEEICHELLSRLTVPAALQVPAAV